MSKARDLGDAANQANFLDNVTSDINTSLNSAAAIPAGLILPFGNTTAPTGYLACDGSDVSKETYANLFAAIGTTWGTAANPTTHFKLPDLRGAFLRGTGSHGTSNMANGNDFAGPSVGSFENDQMQQHGHNMDSISGAVSDYFGGSTANYGINPTYVSADYDRVVGTVSSHAYDGTPRTGNETRPFNAGILYCISTGPSVVSSGSGGSGGSGSGGGTGGGTSSGGGSSSGGGGSSSPASTTSHANFMSTDGELLVDSAGEALTTETVDDTVAQVNTKLGGL